MKHLSTSEKLRHRSRWGVLAASALFALTLAGCSGDDGKDGQDGQDADPAVTDNLQDQIDAIVQSPETCVTCHTGSDPVALSGSAHQAAYDGLYRPGVMAVSNMSFTTSGGNTAILTFSLTKNGAAFDCTKSTSSSSDFSIGSYWAEYDVATKTFPSDKSLAGTKSYNAATGVCTFTQTVTAEEAAKMAGNGIVQIYGTEEIVGRLTEHGKRWSYAKYPFAGVLKVGTVDYTTAANVSGCENCHTQPFLKHGYIFGKVTDNTGAETQFYTCKGCHYDTRQGGHIDWQILYDDPERYAEIQAGSAITPEEQVKYAYKAKLMNDVHMSHNMEFAYPQTMRNCVTCHAGKHDQILADSQFQAETCQSCHAIDGLTDMMASAGFPHTNIIPNLKTTDCTACHRTGGAAPTFATLHLGGYDPEIYTTAGVRYSDTFVVSVDSTTIDANNKMTIRFSAVEKTDIPGMAVSGITPTVMVGLYGYDSKDFIVAAHGRDENRQRLLEYVVGTEHPRFTTVSASNGQWEVTADLSMWADMIADGTVRRAEIAVMPALQDPNGVTVGLNAPSRTFDLSKNAFDDAYFSDIVNVAGGCNTCHDQLATSFHSGNRGGNIKVCRICHEVSSPGSHLELQSRSIDSYVHAIHSFQAFDLDEIDFTDPVEAIEYEHHIYSQFPRFGVLDCQSCHNPGTYDVPNQAKSMPSVSSATYEVNVPRKIGDLPQTVTGPAARACGACHRSQKLNADDSSGLTILNEHFNTFGYVVENREGLWEEVVKKMMSVFK